MSGSGVFATEDDCKLPDGTVLRIDAVSLDDGALKVRCVYTPVGETEPKLYGSVIPRTKLDSRRLELTLSRAVRHIEGTGVALPELPATPVES